MVFSLLTTEPNAEVGAVHNKAILDCLLTEDQRQTWMLADVEEALALQKRALDGALKVVAGVPRQDEVRHVDE